MFNPFSVILTNRRLRTSLLLVLILFISTAIEITLVISCNNQIQTEYDLNNNIIKVNCSIITCTHEYDRFIIEYSYKDVIKNGTITSTDSVSICPKYVSCYYDSDDIESLSLTRIVYHSDIIGILIGSIIGLCVFIISIIVILLMGIYDYNSEKLPLLDGMTINQMYDENEI